MEYSPRCRIGAARAATSGVRSVAPVPSRWWTRARPTGRRAERASPSCAAAWPTATGRCRPTAPRPRLESVCSDSSGQVLVHPNHVAHRDAVLLHPGRVAALGAEEVAFDLPRAEPGLLVEGELPDAGVGGAHHGPGHALGPQPAEDGAQQPGADPATVVGFVDGHRL